MPYPQPSRLFPAQAARPPWMEVMAVGVLLYGIFLAALPMLAPVAKGTSFILFATLAALLYLGSHAMRAARLAVITMPMLGLSFRTAFFLHLYVAPWSLILPFKLDELIRVRELARAGRSWPRAVASVLIDRSMDGTILIALAVMLFSAGFTATVRFIAFVGVALTLIAVGFFLLPAILEAMQRHIFAYHYRPRALYMLRLVSGARALLIASRRTIAGVLPFLVVSTAGIWGLEFGAVVTLLGGTTAPPARLLETVEVMLRRADASWRPVLFHQAADARLVLLTLTFLGVVLLPWPLVAWLYPARSAGEPRRPRLPQRGSLAPATSGRD